MPKKPTTTGLHGISPPKNLSKCMSRNDAHRNNLSKKYEQNMSNNMSKSQNCRNSPIGGCFKVYAYVRDDVAHVNVLPNGTSWPPNMCHRFLTHTFSTSVSWSAPAAKQASRSSTSLSLISHSERSLHEQQSPVVGQNIPQVMLQRGELLESLGLPHTSVRKDVAKRGELGGWSWRGRP